MSDFTQDDEKLADLKARFLASFKPRGPQPTIDDLLQAARDQEAGEMRDAALDIVRKLTHAYAGGCADDLWLAVGEICGLLGEPQPSRRTEWAGFTDDEPMLEGEDEPPIEHEGRVE